MHEGVIVAHPVLRLSLVVINAKDVIKEGRIYVLGREFNKNNKINEKVLAVAKTPMLVFGFLLRSSIWLPLVYALEN